MLKKPGCYIPLIIIGVLILCCVGLQGFTLTRSYTNPPVAAEPNWDSPRTRELFMRTCGDCHSNETVWPWYSRIFPVSLLVANDVYEGRGRFNVSEWGVRENEAGDAAEIFQEGEMPPAQFLLMHPEARLTPAEKQELLQGLIATFSAGG
jgi:Haem-binding domain